MAFLQLPELVRKEKDPGVIGHFYMLILICRCRWPRKLKIGPKDGRRYHDAFRDFILRLGRDQSDALRGHCLDAAHVYAEAAMVYSILLHSKLTGPIFKYDAPVGDYDLMNVTEQYNLRKGLEQP